MRPSPKIVSLDQLIKLRDTARQAGQSVVHCHGCFDIVHPGHVQHLQFARSLGDRLLVSVSSDAHVNKGVARPLIPDDLRASSLAALECVDWVYVDSHPTATDLLETIRPDVYVKGKEYESNCDPRFLAERDTVQRHGGRVVFSSGDVVYSSTALIETMAGADLFRDEKVRRFRDANGLSTAALSALMGRFRQLRVVVVGDYILDRYCFCDATGVAGEAPVMALRRLRDEDYDGGAAVVALHAAALGATPILVTSLAQDDASRHTALRLAGRGIEVCRAAPRSALVTKSRFLVDQSKLFKLDDGRPMPPDSVNTEQTAQALLAAAEGADAVIFADFGYGTITPGLLQRVMEPLRKTVPIITADVSGRQSNLLLFKSVDLLCPTEREARETMGDFSSGLGALVWDLLQRADARHAIITMGRQGLVAFDRPAGEPNGRLTSQYLPALAGRVIDPLGCGDALLAAASLTLAAGGSLAAAAYLGSAAAAIEVQQLGNRPVAAEELSLWARPAHVDIERAAVLERLAS